VLAAIRGSLASARETVVTASPVSAATVRSVGRARGLGLKTLSVRIVPFLDQGAGYDKIVQRYNLFLGRRIVRPDQGISLQCGE
jgi:hypothetical protein